jgi:2-methylcitrate dehydratase PrpD
VGTILQRFAKFFADVNYEELPQETVHQAKLLTIDLLGVSIAGLRMDFPSIMIDYLKGLGGIEEATLLGAGRKVPAIHAALGNGVCGHALDMDDGYRFGGVHTGVALIPAAVAFAEARQSDGRTLLKSIVLGFEIVNRLSKAMNPSHLNRGFHTTGTLGVFGAATACGVIAGLTEPELVSALGIAGLQGAGLLEVLHDGAMVKPIHPGKACMAGILSVELAKRGSRGPATVLEGPKGVFKAMTDAVSAEALFEDFGRHFLINDQYVKFHAACRHIHPVIDGVLSLMGEKQLRFDDIAAIDIATYPVAISFCGGNPFPLTAEAAKFSLCYSTAMAAYFGDVHEHRYCQAVIENPEIGRLASNVSIKTEEKWARLYPDRRGATVTMQTRIGKFYTVEVPLAKGEPENRGSQSEIVSKFRRNAGGISDGIVGTLLETLLSLEKRNVSHLSEILRHIIL